jgi:predicted GIY-YIG superfamily endonuclease
MKLDEVIEKMNIAAIISSDNIGQISLNSGVYTAWLDDNPQCLYVGRSKNLRKRIGSHYSGDRSGDRFCLYIYDRYIHDSRPNAISTAEVNKLTSVWIQKHVSFRLVEVAISEISALENGLRREWRPSLNPINS